MGFHLIEQVYSTVVGTSSTEQAILIYLAHRADDEGIRPCFPSMPRIAAETHFDISSVKRALKSLRKKHLLTWVSGGRKKGGRPLANSYVFTLPAKRGLLPAVKGVHTDPLQGFAPPPCTGSHCPPAGAHTAPPSTIYQLENQPSVIGGSDAEAEKDRSSVIQRGADWIADKKAEIDEKVRLAKAGRLSVIDEAMKAAGVSDMENKRIFTSTLMSCYTANMIDRALEVIWEFASERRNGAHVNLGKPAAELNKRLARLMHGE